MVCGRLLVTIIFFVVLLIPIIIKLNSVPITVSPIDHTARAAVNYTLTPGPLLGEYGELLESGWSTKLVKHYDRDAIGAPGFLIKEWDYYYVGNSEVGFAFTVADNSYVGLISVSVLNFTSQTYITKSKIIPLTFGALNMPSSSEIGDIEYRDDDGYMMRIVHVDNMGDDSIEPKVQIEAYWPDFFDGEAEPSFAASFMLSNTTHDSMVIVSPFDAAPSRRFYYNQKINNMPTIGKVEMKKEVLQFNNETRLLSVFDWGRGVWSYDNTWYWSSLSTYLPTGDSLGFNLGYGFSIRNGFSENMVIFNGKAHKLGEVHFFIPVKDNGEDDFMKTWTITDDQGRLALQFVPVLDRADDVNLFVIRSWQHQVFGKFYGRVVLDDGRVIELNGETVGFAEKVANRW